MYGSDYQRSAEARQDEELVLEFAEVFPANKRARLLAIFSDGSGAAFHEQSVAKLLKYHRLEADSTRLAGLFGESDLHDGFRDPRVKAALLLGITELVDSKGEINSAKATKILNTLMIPASEDLRDNLAAYAKAKTDGGQPSKWDASDFVTAVLTVGAIAGQLKKLPWAKIGAGAAVLLRRGR